MIQADSNSFECLLMNFTTRTGKLGISGVSESPGWLVWISCLDLSTVVAVTSHPLESSKD